MKTTKLFALHMLNGGFLVEIPSTGLYLVNGVETTLRSASVTFDELPTLQSIYKETEITDYFRGEERLSYKEYNDMTDLLSRNMTRDEDGEMIFKTLEDEFEYRKFVRGWSPVTVTTTRVSGDYEFEVIPEIKSDYSYISPMRHLGKDVTKNMFQLNRLGNALSAFGEFGAKYGFIRVEDRFSKKNAENEFSISNASNSGLRFAKIGESYIFSESEAGVFNKDMVADYDTCVKTLISDRGLIEKKFLLVLNDRKKFLDGTTISMVLDKVKQIKSTASKIDEKKTSTTYKNFTLKQLNELMADLEKLILNSEKAS